MNNVFDFSIVTNWIHQMLTSLMPEGLAIFLECVVIGVCIILMYAVLAIILIYMERKICAFFQCRLGPMRVGKWGLLQVPCDVIKMLTKEIIDLKFSDRFLYNLAPFMVIIASFLTFACLPINKGLEVLDFNVGVFFLLAASSIGVVGILLAGWSSNNKFSLIGAMRSGALHHLPHCRKCGNQPRSLRLARSRKRVDCRIPYGIQRYGLRILLSGRIFESVYRSLRGSHHLPGRLDAATHRRPGRLQRSDGLHSGICMVLRKGLLRSLPADVDKVDLPPPAY